MQGQTCVSIQRVYVQHECLDDFLAQLVPEGGGLQVGDPADETTDVGPVIDGANRERITSWIQEALAGGAEIVTGRRRVTGLLRPTVLMGVTPEMKVCFAGDLRPRLLGHPLRIPRRGVRLTRTPPSTGCRLRSSRARSSLPSRRRQRSSSAA
jgi:glyceraldehyde-3-phosphate dehydrogenase (NADP+)